MNKDKLQQELLAKIKPGMKPSDLKKQKRNIKSPKDEGYSSGEEKLNKSIPKAPPLPNQSLLDQIASLKKQLQTYKDFKEVDLKIKERYKEEIQQLKGVIQKSNTLIADKDQIIGKHEESIKELQGKIKEHDKTIEELKKQGKNTANIKQELFNCYNCKKQREISLLVLELPEGKLCQPC